MHLLPTNLAPLADMAAKDEGKYAMTGIQLVVHGDNTYRAAGTDGKRLLVVSGPCPGDVQDWPTGNPIWQAPNGGTESIVPATAWRKAFRDAAKSTRKEKTDSLRSLGVTVSKEVTSFATSVGTFEQHQSVKDARFPPYMDVIPPESKARDFIDIDPWYLASVLDSIAAIGDDCTKRVRMELHRGENIVLRYKNPDSGQEAVGMVVGLLPPEGQRDNRSDKCKATPAELRTALDAAQAEIEQLKERVAAVNERAEQSGPGSFGKLKGVRKELAEADAEIAKLNEQLAAARKGIIASALFAKATGENEMPATPAEDAVEVAQLRRQVQVLQSINDRLVREQGMVGT